MTRTRDNSPVGRTEWRSGRRADPWPGLPESLGLRDVPTLRLEARTVAAAALEHLRPAPVVCAVLCLPPRRCSSSSPKPAGLLSASSAVSLQTT